MAEIVVRHKALPKQLQFVRSTAAHVMYSGAFGAGKTRAIALKAIVRAGAHEWAREFLCRKHLVTFRATTLKTLLEGDGEAPPVLTPGAYEHNKSERVIRIKGAGCIVYGGLDDMLKIRSGGFSGVGIDEAIETTETDYRELVGRVRIAVPGLPLQTYSATNPGAPSHHLAVRFGCGTDGEPQAGCEVIHTSAYDNRHLPPAYIAELERMSGVARRRYLMGEWCGSEGLVYDTFDRSLHLVPVPRTRPDRVVLAIDQGFTDAFCCLRGELHGGRLWIAREVYGSGMLYGDKMDAIRGMAPGAEIIVVDPSAAELIADLKAQGLPAVKAYNPILPGIGMVQARLGPPQSPGLAVDPSCVNTVREFESYEWSPERPGSDKRVDTPIDRDNHTCFVAGTMVGTPAGDRPIESVRSGDVVNTPAGPRLVLAAGEVGVRAVGHVAFEGGRSLVGTADHPVWTDRGWCRMDSLRYGDTIAACPTSTASVFGSMATCTVDTRGLGTGQRPSTSSPSAAGTSIGRFTSTSSGRSRKATTSTTGTETRSTIGRRILSACRAASTCLGTVYRYLPSVRQNGRPTLNGSGRSPARGTAAPRGLSGIGRTHTTPDSGTPICPSAHATSAASRTSPDRVTPGSAQTTANQPTAEQLASMTRTATARRAERCSGSTDTQSSGVVLGRVLKPYAPIGVEAVYNLTVADQHVYFANGVLVSNCDAARYCVSWFDMQRSSVVAVREGWKGAAPSAPESGSLDFPAALLRSDFRTGEYPERLRWSADPAGALRLWGELRQDYGTGALRPWQEDRFVIGASVGAGLGHGRSAVAVARLSDRSKALEFARDDLDPIELARFVCLLALWLGGRARPVIGWHATGPGEAFGRHLRQRLCWGAIYTAREAGRLAEAGTDRIGWQGDADDLRGLLLTYAADLRSGRYVQRSQQALDELGRFVIENGQALDYLEQDEGVGDRRESGSLAIADAIVARIIERATWTEPEDPKIAAAKRNPRTIRGMQEAERLEKLAAARDARPWDGF